MRRLVSSAAALFLLLAGGAQAATVSRSGGELRVIAAPGEANAIAISRSGDGLWWVVTDPGGPPAATAPCVVSDIVGGVLCPTDGTTGMYVRAGDGNDSVDVAAGTLPVGIDGGSGDDTLTTGAGDDTVAGGAGADRISTGPGADRIDGGAGADVLRGGSGADRLRSRDRSTDSVSCGPGRDVALSDAKDWIEPCESVDYGRSGLVGPTYVKTGGGRFVAIPGQPGMRLDRRLLPDLAYLIARYHVRVTAGYSLSSVHTARGEHPLGLATDLVPGPGGSWDDVDRLAKWAEPRQNHPRWPFRWVGYDGDYNHGRGNHLHLSWAHSTGHYGRPARSVWLFSVRRAGASAAAAPAGPPSRYVAPEPQG